MGNDVVIGTNKVHTEVMTTTNTLWEDVEAHIDNTILIAWDGCHKIYMALDQHEADYFRSGYPYIVEDTSEAMLATLMDWYNASCGLKFVSGVRYNPDNPNDGFISLIEQFDERDPDMAIDEEEI
jgi:hypothetical protein